MDILLKEHLTDSTGESQEYADLVTKAIIGHQDLA